MIVLDKDNKTLVNSKTYITEGKPFYKKEKSSLMKLAEISNKMHFVINVVDYEKILSELSIKN